MAEVTGMTRVFALVGHPVGRSLSPRLHGAMLRRYGVDGVYVALDVVPERAPQVGDAIRTLGLAGVNLTVPFKEAVLPSLDRLDAGAAAIGAANVVVREGDRLVGANTDAPGLVAALRHEHGEVWAGARVLVLGAGGAGRAAAWGALEAGAASVVVLNRDVARAEAVAARLGGASADGLDAAAWERHAPSADVVLVCVSDGGVGAGWDVSRLGSHAVVCDLNYWHAAPALLSAARAAGRRTQDGLPMLVWQAALAFEWFTGVAADPVWLLSTVRPGSAGALDC
jgi:shikimate dehydrogenase